MLKIDCFCSADAIFVFSGDVFFSVDNALFAFSQWFIVCFQWLMYCLCSVGEVCVLNG